MKKTLIFFIEKSRRNTLRKCLPLLVRFIHELSSTTMMMIRTIIITSATKKINIIDKLFAVCALSSCFIRAHIKGYIGNNVYEVENQLCMCPAIDQIEFDI